MSRYCPPNTSVRMRTTPARPALGPLGQPLPLGRDDVVGPRLRDVAEQDCRREPELVRRAPPVAVPVHRGEVHMGGGPAAAGRRRVDHVVVHQRECVQQLQRGKQQQRIGIGRLGGDGVPSPVSEDRPQSLAPAEHEIFEPAGQRVVVGAQVSGFAATVVQIPSQLVGDGAGHLDGRRCCRCFQAQRGAPFCSAGQWTVYADPGASTG